MLRYPTANAVAAVARHIGIDHDGAVLLVLEFLDRVPTVGREIRLEVEAFTGFLSGCPWTGGVDDFTPAGGEVPPARPAW